jgi:phage shock protein E
MRWIPLLFLFLLSGGGCASTPPEAAKPEAAGEAEPVDASEASTAEPLPDRDPQLAKKLVAEGAVLLDVRTQQEWDDRHLEGANLIPVQELGDRLDEVSQLTGGDESKPIVVYCKSGGRAGRAKEMLTEAGYTQVTNMGGIDDWPAE